MIAPKLRFSEFKDEWRSEKISEIANVSSGSTPNRNNPSYWNGDIPWVTTSLINFNTIEKAEEFITKEGLKNSSTKLYPKNTILMAMYGQGVTRGKVAILGIEATTNQACASISLKPNFNVSFIFQNLSKRYEEIRDLSNDGGQKNLSGSIIKEISISYPTEKEQTKIAEFLSAVDDKISQLSRQLELLNQYKQGVMQKIFSQEIRFKNDNGEDFREWDFVELGEICDLITKGTTPTSIGGNFIDQGINFIKIESITENGNFIREKFAFIDEDTNKLLNRSILKENDILFSIAGALGRVAIVDSSILPANTNQALAIIRLKNKDFTKFIYYFLNSEKIKKLIENESVQLAQANFSLGQLSKIEIALPSIQEQAKIAEFLTAIDERIDHTTAQLTHTKHWKKGLLQQMFV